MRIKHLFILIWMAKLLKRRTSLHRPRRFLLLLPEPEYPAPLYRQEDYWDGSLYGNRRPVNISTGKYVDETGNVVLHNADWMDRALQKWNSIGQCWGEYNPIGHIQKGKWGIIDTSGNYIVEPVWDGAKRETDGNIIAALLIANTGLLMVWIQKVPFEYDRLYYYGKT